MATNDNWGDNANAAEITTIAAQAGTTPFRTGDTTSAALLVTLDPGAYTFVVSGKNGSSGVVLLEVYDVDSGTSSSFAGIATRAYGTVGDRVPIGGFVISGSARKQVLVRAVGPTLTTQGIAQADVMADPVIELHSGAPTIAINDDWADNANGGTITSESQRVGTTALAAFDAESSALLLTLAPGGYTFISRGAAETSGIVLIEVYDAD